MKLLKKIIVRIELIKNRAEIDLIIEFPWTQFVCLIN